MRDLKFNMRLFELWKRKEKEVMSHTRWYQKLPPRSDPRKRKRTGRGRLFKKGNKLDSSSASDSPMKRVHFDLTAFSDEEVTTTLKVREETSETDEDAEDDDEDDEDAKDDGEDAKDDDENASDFFSDSENEEK